MNNYTKTFRLLITLIWISMFALLFAANGNAQSSGIDLKSSVFTFKRPVGAGAAASNTVYKKKSQLAVRKRENKTIKSSGATSATSKPTAEQLGVTLWRLRPEKSGDTGARLLTMKGSGQDSAKMVADRVKIDTVFQKGEKVRLSVESPNSGYLYIIDREMRTDGSVGDAYLIFPTLTTSGGNNKVTAGKLIEIPSQTDDPFYFDITPTEKNYAGELLTFMISPTKIEGLELTNGPLKLPSSLVDKWETMWEGKSTTYELDGKGRDLSYTEEEKEAGIGSRLLTQKSPAPQTLITVDASKGKPFLVSIPMKVSKQEPK